MKKMLLSHLESTSVEPGAQQGALVSEMVNRPKRLVVFYFSFHRVSIMCPHGNKTCKILTCQNDISLQSKSIKISKILIVCHISTSFFQIPDESLQKEQI